MAGLPGGALPCVQQLPWPEHGSCHLLNPSHHHSVQCSSSSQTLSSSISSFLRAQQPLHQSPGSSRPSESSGFPFSSHPASRRPLPICSPLDSLSASSSRDSFASYSSSAGNALSLHYPDSALPEVESGGGDDDGNNGAGNKGRGRGGGAGGSGEAGGDGERADGEGEGLLLDLQAVQRLMKERNVVLPPEMLDRAAGLGLPSLLLQRYCDLQGAPWPLGPAVRAFPALRNRLLADPAFLFKIFTEVVIDSGCATFAEVQKRGDDFWKEFEFYLSDLGVGIVMDIALVSMLAPCARFAAATSATAAPLGATGRLSRVLASLPNNMFEGGLPGQGYSGGQRVATLFYKGLQYGAAGFSAGLVGQGIANALMNLRRSTRPAEASKDEVHVPPLLKSAVLWGVFMAVSSNVRYQVINGLESVVEGSFLARKVPPLALGFTVAIRFGNNIFGGMQFVDWARWAGVQ